MKRGVKPVKPMRPVVKHGVKPVVEPAGGPNVDPSGKLDVKTPGEPIVKPAGCKESQGKIRRMGSAVKLQ